MKWLEVEENIRHLQLQINEANKSTSKLELRNHHANMLLKEEVKARINVQEEKRLIVSYNYIYLHIEHDYLQINHFYFPSSKSN